MEPGKIIIYDQYKSRLLGRVFGNIGYKITSQVYKGGTIFWDVASRKISLQHQVSFTEEETSLYKLKFERGS